MMTSICHPDHRHFGTLSLNRAFVERLAAVFEDDHDAVARVDILTKAIKVDESAMSSATRQSSEPGRGAGFSVDMAETLKTYFDAYAVDGRVSIEVTDRGLWLQTRIGGVQFLGSTEIIRSKVRH